VLDRISQFMANHPMLTTGLAVGGAAAGAGLMVGGKVLMTAGIMKFLGINPVAMIQGTIGTIVSWASTALGFLGRSILFLGRALFMNPIGLTVLAIAAAAYLLYKNWKTVGPYVMEAWSIIKAVFHVSMKWISDRAKDMWATVGPYVAKAWSILTALGSVVGSTFSSIYNAISGWLGKIVNWIANSAIGRAIGWVGGQIAGAASAVGGAIGRDFQDTYDWSKGVNAQYEGGASPYVWSGGRPGAQSQGDVYIDGKKAGKIVAPHVANEIGRVVSRAPNAGGAFDTSRAPMWPSSGNPRR
jgi:hypothetical protein